MSEPTQFVSTNAQYLCIAYPWKDYKTSTEIGYVSVPLVEGEAEEATRARLEEAAKKLAALGHYGCQAYRFVGFLKPEKAEPSELLKWAQFFQPYFDALRRFESKGGKFSARWQ